MEGVRALFLLAASDSFGGRDEVGVDCGRLLFGEVTPFLLNRGRGVRDSEKDDPGGWFC